MSGKIKIAIFAGKFDPFINGDKIIIEGLIELSKFNHIIVMPLGLAPYNEKYMTPSGYRYEMVRLGIRSLAGVTLSDYEINRPGRYSYTVDTIDYFKEKFNKEQSKGKKIEIHLVYDSKALHTIEHWHKPEEIMKKAKLLIFRRESENFKKIKERADYLRTKYRADIDFFKVKESDKLLSPVKCRS